AVRALRVRPLMNPRVPPKIAPSSTNPARRAPTPRKRSGPARTERDSPTSAPSICQPPPSVATKPSPSAVCAASGVDKAASTPNIPTMDRRTFVLLTGAASSGLVRPPDRLLPTVRGVRLFQTADALPGDGDLTALVNGYHSWSANHVERVRAAADMPDLVSFAALGLTRGARGLGLAFDPGEPGEAKVKI